MTIFKRVISASLAVLLCIGVAVAAPLTAGAAQNDGKVYFEVPDDWEDVGSVYFWLYNKTSGEEVYQWGSKKGKMTAEGSGVWSFDLAGKGYALSAGEEYGCIFSADWNLRTDDLIISADNYGDTALADGDTIRTTKSCPAKWKSGKNGTPVKIDAVGNVSGNDYWKGQSAYTVLLDYIKGNFVPFAARVTNRTAQQVIDDIAEQLGLSDADKEKAVAEAKKAAPELRISNKSNGIRAEWNEIFGAKKYIVYFKQTGASKWSSYETTDTFYPFLKLTPGVNYSVQAQAVSDNNVKGSYSRVQKLTYIPQVKPALTLSNKSNGIRAEWKAVTGATKYIVYYKVDGAAAWSSAETANTCYPLLRLIAGTKYAVQVQAVFGSAKGLYSAVKRLVYIPQVKPTLTLSNKSNGIRAEWNAVSGAAKYIVYYKKSSDSSWSSAQTANTYYPLLNLTKGVSYSVQVQPVFGSVNGLYSKVASLVYQPADNRPTLTLTRTSKGLDVSWKAQSGATEYILYYKVENGDWTQFKTPYTTVHMSKMVSGTKYSFQIRMIYGSKPGGYSKVAAIVY